MVKKSVCILPSKRKLSLVKLTPQDIPKRWDAGVWCYVWTIATRMSRDELIRFYEETGAVRTDTFAKWSKEDLLGVLDEIGRDDIPRLIEQYTHYLSRT